MQREADPILQVAAAAELVGRHEEALQYVELWSADVTQSARLPDAAEAIASAERRGVVDAQSASAHGQAAAGLDLSPEEVVLWGAYGALGDPDLSSGVAAIPKVRKTLGHVQGWLSSNFTWCRPGLRMLLALAV